MIAELTAFMQVQAHVVEHNLVSGEVINSLRSYTVPR